MNNTKEQSVPPLKLMLVQKPIEQWCADQYPKIKELIKNNEPEKAQHLMTTKAHATVLAQEALSVWQACANGQIGEVKKSIETFIKEYKSNDWLTPAQALKELLKSIDTGKNNGVLTEDAVQEFRAGIQNTLLDLGLIPSYIKHRNTPTLQGIHSSMISMYKRSLESAIEEKNDSQVWIYLAQAVHNNDRDMCEFIFNNLPQDKPYLLSLRNGHLNTILHYAAAHVSCENFSYLLHKTLIKDVIDGDALVSNDTRVNDAYRDVYFCDLSGLLNSAIAAHHTDNAQKLFDYHPSLIDRVDQKTPLIRAVESGSPEMVQMILARSDTYHLEIRVQSVNKQKPLPNNGKVALGIAAKAAYQAERSLTKALGKAQNVPLNTYNTADDNTSIALSLLNAGADPYSISFSERKMLFHKALEKNDIMAIVQLTQECPVLSDKIARQNDRLWRTPLLVPMRLITTGPFLLANMLLRQARLNVNRFRLERSLTPAQKDHYHILNAAEQVNFALTVMKYLAPPEKPKPYSQEPLPNSSKSIAQSNSTASLSTIGSDLTSQKNISQKDHTKKALFNRPNSSSSNRKNTIVRS